MDRRFAYEDSLEDRIAEAVDVMRLALARQAPYLALATAREAARAALLALGQVALDRALSPCKRDLALLRDVATATPQRFTGRQEERQAMVQATLALLDRLFPRPGPAQGGPESREGGNVRPGAGAPAAPGPGPGVPRGNEGFGA